MYVSIPGIFSVKKCKISESKKEENKQTNKQPLNIYELHPDMNLNFLIELEINFIHIKL